MSIFQDSALDSLMVSFNDVLVGAGISVSTGVDWNIVVALFVMGYVFARVWIKSVEAIYWLSLPAFKKRDIDILEQYLVLSFLSLSFGTIFALQMPIPWVVLHIKQYTFQFLIIGSVFCAADLAIPKGFFQIGESHAN
jgi:hypothetical protein